MYNLPRHSKDYGSRGSSTWNNRLVYSKNIYSRNKSHESEKINPDIVARSVMDFNKFYHDAVLKNTNLKNSQIEEQKNNKLDVFLLEKMFQIRYKGDELCYRELLSNIMRDLMSRDIPLFRNFLFERHSHLYFGLEHEEDKYNTPIEFLSVSKRHALVSIILNNLINTTEIFPYIFASFLSPNEFIAGTYEYIEDSTDDNDIMESASQDDLVGLIEREYFFLKYNTMANGQSLSIPEFAKILEERFRGYPSFINQGESMLSSRVIEDIIRKIPDEEIVNQMRNLQKEQERLYRSKSSDYDFSANILQDEDTDEGEEYEDDEQDIEMENIEIGREIVYFPKTKKISPHIIREYKDIINLRDIIEDLSDKELGNILYILFDGLEKANRKFGYINYNLDIRNIGIVDNGEELLHKCGVVSRFTPKILDSTFSRIIINANGVKYNLYYHDITGSYNSFYENYPLSDIYQLLSSIYEYSVSDIAREGINNFWKKILSPYNETGNNIWEYRSISGKIPYLGTFLENIKYKDIMNQLNIRIHNDSGHKCQTKKEANKILPILVDTEIYNGLYEEFSHISSKNYTKVSELLDIMLAKLVYIIDEELPFTTHDHHTRVLEGLQVERNFTEEKIKELSGKIERGGSGIDRSYNKNLLAKLRGRYIELSREILELKENFQVQREGFYDEYNKQRMDYFYIEKMYDIMGFCDFVIENHDGILTLGLVNQLKLAYTSIHSIGESLKDRMDPSKIIEIDDVDIETYIEELILKSKIKSNAMINIYERYRVDRNGMANADDLYIVLNNEERESLKINLRNMRSSNESLIKRNLVNPAKNIYGSNLETFGLNITEKRYYLEDTKNNILSWLKNKTHKYSMAAKRTFMKYNPF